MAVTTFAMPVRSYCFAGFAHVIMAAARPNLPETGRIAADVRPIEILVAAAVGSQFATATCSVRPRLRSDGLFLIKCMLPSQSSSSMRKWY